MEGLEKKIFLNSHLHYDCVSVVHCVLLSTVKYVMCEDYDGMILYIYESAQGNNGGIIIYQFSVYHNNGGGTIEMERSLCQ